MKLSPQVTIAIAILIAIVVFLSFRETNIASSGISRFEYSSFKTAKQNTVQGIINYWRANETRASAIRTSIYLNLLFMITICTYLFIRLNGTRQIEKRRWLKLSLRIAVISIIFSFIIHVIQDFKILQYLNSKDEVSEMRNYTIAKRILFFLGIIPLLLSFIPYKIISIDSGRRLLRFLSQLLQSIWIFFPGILFLLLGIFCFWSLGQGKDIIVAFTENKSRTIFSLNYTRVVFILAIGFWVYVSWYSSRIISYVKKTRQQKDLEMMTGKDKQVAESEYNQRSKFFEVGKDFLDEFPRIIGNSCFLILELAVLQSPILYSSINTSQAYILFALLLSAIVYINTWIRETQALKASFRKTFWALFWFFIVLVIAVSLFVKISIYILFFLLILFHLVFIYYINLRRIEMEKTAARVKAETKSESPASRTLLERLMDYFCIPRKESGYFKSFLVVTISGIILYFVAIILLDFARRIGPFSFIILAFGVLLSFGNTVTAFSVRYKLNFHFLLFVIAFILSNKETHFVRTINLNNQTNNYDARPHLRTYLSAWLNDRKVLEDSTADGYDMYFVMANGGASRSGYWTAALLGKIEDSSLSASSPGRFSDHIFCLSGTSGGGVGVASFFSLLRDKERQTGQKYEASAKSFLRKDYFTYTFARMLGPDFFNYIFHVAAAKDRGAALEESFEESSLDTTDNTYQVPFYDTLSQFPAMKEGKVYLPILFVNTTRMQDGTPGVVSNLTLDAAFNNRVDVLKLLGKNHDISITSGSILGARFPYLSPAGRIADSYFVDGGYFDNSGAGVVQEIIRGIVNIGREDSMSNGNLYKQIKKLHFKVLHIVNSPVGFNTGNVKPVDPIKNDLLAPILTIVGTYDMQTTVNDIRLMNFINDINKFSDNPADYMQISLYEEPNEWRRNPLRARYGREPSYAMNWFMSDTTLNRINNRLHSHTKLDSIIKSMMR